MATIIRPETMDRPSGAAVRGVAYNLADMGVQVDDYLQTIQREAGKIIADAKKEAATIRADAEASGRRAAEQAIDRILDEKVGKQMKTLTPALQAAVAQIQDAKQDWLTHWEAAATGLAVEIAGRLVRGEISRRPEIGVEWLREALELACGSGEIVVRLNPADQQTLARQVDQLAAVFAPLGSTRVVADESITLGGCRIATSFGEVDLQLESQLERIREELM